MEIFLAAVFSRAKILRMRAVAVVFVLGLTSLFGAGIRAETPAQSQAKAFFGALPEKMPGADKDTPEMVVLGQRLFKEKKLSANGTQSCNSCHRVDSKMGGVDNEPTSPGAFGKRGGRNSPTVLNAGFQMAQFWDGRAPSLEHQAKGPILNPVEMAMENDQATVKRLRETTEYPPLFKKAFPQDKEPITYDNVARAIAAFERTLVTHDRFDDFQKGDGKALNSTELKGLKLFVETGCATCHSGPALGGNSFQKAGLVHPWDTSDIGRAEVTKDDDDKFKFKVPMLRNIALTGPYFHDGKVISLEEAVRKMAWHQLDKRLSDEEVSDIVAFLNSLTDKTRVTGKQHASK
jgi:cytochrome c peroxidase